MNLLPPALRSRNYRLFFGGQGLSLIGSWMTQTATIWLVYQLTNSALWLGVVGFVSQIPSLILAPFGGIIVDRVNRRRLLIITQILSAIQSLALAILAFAGAIDIRHLIGLSIFQGFINVIDAPARQAFVPEMVERRDDLASAIALNSSIFNVARLLGPSIAGLVIAAAGSAACFLIDGISYFAVIASLLAMKIKPKKIVHTNNNFWQRLTEGFIYAFGFPPIRSILLLLALFSFMAMPIATLMPIFAREILQGGPQTLGFLMAASGLGALTGGIYLAGRRTVVGLGNLIVIAPAIVGIGMVIFGLSRFLWLSLLISAIVGFGTIWLVASSNTVIQTIVEDDKRGRVMSLYTMAFFGMAPLGNLFSGALADRIGAPNTIIVGGIFCIFGSIYFARQLPALRRLVIPIYQEKGILGTSKK
jgi:MFS family permease